MFPGQKGVSWDIQFLVFCCLLLLKKTSTYNGNKNGTFFLTKPELLNLKEGKVWRTGQGRHLLFQRQLSIGVLGELCQLKEADSSGARHRVHRLPAMICGWSLQFVYEVIAYPAFSLGGRL